MLKRTTSTESATNRPTFALRVTGEYADFCELFNYVQLAKLRKTLAAIAIHEITSYDKAKQEENQDGED